MRTILEQKKSNSTQVTSKRTIIIYIITFLLMVLLDVGRVVPMLNRIGADFPPATITGKILQKTAAVSGLTALSKLESKIIGQLSPNIILASELSSSNAVLEKTSQDQNEITQPSQNSSERHSDTTQNYYAENFLTVPSQLLETSSSKETNHQHNSACSFHSHNTSSNISEVTTVLIIGDSMVKEGFGPVLQRTLSKQNTLKVIREGKYSTGLSRPEYFDWSKHLKQLIQKYHPDLIIICLGANDSQDIFDQNKIRYHPGSDKWKTIYYNRAKQLLNIAGSEGALVIWAGLPIMGKMPYASQIIALTDCQKKACEDTPNTQFVDTQSVLATSQGKYTSYIQEANRHIRLRAKDKIHVTEAGGQRLTQYLMPYIQTALTLCHEKESRSDKIDNLSLLPYGTDSILYVPSAARQKSVPCLVFMPATSKKTNYPVLLLLHPAHTSYESWKTLAGDMIQSLANCYEIVIIAPDGEKTGWYVDSPIIKTSQIETFIIEELRPYMLQHLPITNKWSILGISMGGHGAIMFGLLHPNYFVSMSSLSGILDLTSHPKLCGINHTLGELASNNNRKFWEDHSACELIKKVNPQNVPHMFISTGLEESVVNESRRFLTTALSADIPIQYSETHGQHDWNLWLSLLPLHINFHASHLIPSNTPQKHTDVSQANTFNNVQ